MPLLAPELGDVLEPDEPEAPDDDPLGEELPLLPLGGVPELPVVLRLLPKPELLEEPGLIPDCEPLELLDGDPTLLLPLWD